MIQNHTWNSTSQAIGNAGIEASYYHFRRNGISLDNGTGEQT
jgi:hypothetical protein